MFVELIKQASGIQVKNLSQDAQKFLKSYPQFRSGKWGSKSVHEIFGTYFRPLLGDKPKAGDYQTLAELLGIKPATIYQWTRRGMAGLQRGTYSSAVAERAYRHQLMGRLVKVIRDRAQNEAARMYREGATSNEIFRKGHRSSAKMISRLRSILGLEKVPYRWD